jgi:hypothetical protein
MAPPEANREYSDVHPTRRPNVQYEYDGMSFMTRVGLWKMIEKIDLALLGAVLC